jgi:hypothetical protein
MRFYNFLIKGIHDWVGLLFIENKYRLNQKSTFKVSIINMSIECLGYVY